ncbi:MAG: EF-hand domain-containing protein [Burkholderiaceae bacterium]
MIGLARSAANLQRPNEGLYFMKKLIAVMCGTALMSVSAIGFAQTGMTGSTAGKPMEFKKMDTNNDGWVSREEYLGFYGTRYDSMKRNEKGWVSWSDMQRSDGRFFDAGTTSNTTGNPVTPLPGTKGGVGNPPATGGGSK